MNILLKHSTDSNFSAVRDICTLLRETLAEVPLKKEDIDALELMCNEACNNLIEHQYNMVPDEVIALTITQLDNNLIQLQLTDTGVAFIPKNKTAEIPDPESLPEGGWGLSIIQMLSDKYYRTSDDNGNHLFIERTCQNNA